MRKAWLYTKLAWLFCLSMFLPTAIFNERLERLWAELRGDGDARGPLP